MPSSLLDFDVVDLSDYASRGIKQTLEFIGAASSMRRTVNGTLVDLSIAAFRKYRSVVSCNDQVPPALEGVRPGSTVVMNCVQELSYKTSGGSATRTVVSGSSRTEGIFTYYRPQLTMKILSINLSTDEWGANVGWQMELEEI